MYQMMNEFGTPFTEAEEAMRPKGVGNRFIDKELATSGLENNFGLEWLIAPAVSIVSGIIGGNKQASAARQQANAQNAATDAQFRYDNELYDMGIDKIYADHAQATKSVEIQASNEQRLAEWKDASNLNRYNYDLMIRDREQQSLDQQYGKSNEIYDMQISVNEMAAQSAREDEYRKYEEVSAENKYDQNTAYIEMLQAKGQMASIGSSGRSAAKGKQSTLADYGTQVHLFNKSLTGAQSEMRSVLREIANDKTSADLAAYGAKMLDPGILPDPIQPLATPVSDFLYPREIGDFDFGPRPVKGVYHSPSAAANMVWGTTITGIAGSVASGINTYLASR